MTEETAVAGVDTTTPNVARMYDFYLGGKDNYAADRAAAREVLKFAPHIPALARANRAFLRRAVRHLCAAGVDQFLDIGAGLPTHGNVHEIAQAAAPGSRVVYVDNDPTVLVHGRALLEGEEDAKVVPGDVRDVPGLLADPTVRGLLDLSRPVAVLMVALLHCVADEDDPWAAVAELRDALPPGSHLVLSHICASDHVDPARAAADVYQRSRTTMVLRERAAIERFMDGFELLDPGLAALDDWRPDGGGKRDDLPAWILCGVGRKP
ncbi:SAM-dependent methyltransferase [Actinomadura hibisca]|uniref:SAM-dependent methyltransferase n=1 Tax=Actinomadura hibisca TaxID=68565 RepID=UPI00082D4E11|nr:SAM-dependent methyltransferase [Actinomadura hibisca]